MMKTSTPWVIIQMAFISIALCLAQNAAAVDWEFSGQFSAWVNEAEVDDHWESNLGIRYIPQINLARQLSEGLLFDVEVSANGYLSYDSRDTSDNIDLDLYRFKIRLATAKMEARLGLQKISFGPAFLLRSLQWFDRLDPRDPQKLTDGVYGFRCKYSALNNAGYWAWILLENDDPKGLEFLPSDAKKPEIGGRIQYPVPYGEIAATFHTRKVDLTPYAMPDDRESRYAIDGRWDRVVGFWFEAVLQEQETDLLPFQWVKFTTLGMDYTFGIGNGLYMLGEHLVISLSEDKWEWQDNFHFSAFHFNYPLGFFDALSAICYYNWDEKDIAPYVSWTRTLDALDFTVSCFKYPENGNNLLGLNRESDTVGRGTGAQVLFIYHH